MIWDSWEQFEQFTAAIVRVGGQAFFCQQCGRLMGGTYRGRWQRDYCSNACRQKAYRVRHGQCHERVGRPKKT